MKPPPPPALSIAGSDNSAGAGLQADLKTFGALGCYGLTAATCVVAEIPGRVEAVQAVKPALVAAQIRLCMEAFPVRAAKTGMLYSEPIIRAVAGALRGREVPLVVDPVMVASSGDPLLKPGAVRAYWKFLFPMARLLTPNLDELAFLTGREIRNARGMLEAGKWLRRRTDCAVLLKGGHLDSSAATDYLVCESGTHKFTSPRVRGVSTHGTGCTYSAAITAGLARGLSLEDAVAKAKDHIHRAIAGSLEWPETGTQALRH